MTAPEQWLTVDEGWGRRAVEFASLLEPGACRAFSTVNAALGARPESPYVDLLDDIVRAAWQAAVEH